MKLVILKTYKGEDFKEPINHLIAVKELEPDYYKPETIDRLLNDITEAGSPDHFTLQTNFAIYEFIIH